MLERYADGSGPPADAYAGVYLRIQRPVADAPTRADAALERFRIDEAIHAVWTIVDELNGYITANEPWALAKDDAQRARLGTVLYTAAEGLRALAALRSPVIPVDGRNSGVSGKRVAVRVASGVSRNIKEKNKKKQEY